jgi:GR25 family glycosyltransferase involved in LPS biosynthesis
VDKEHQQIDFNKAIYINLDERTDRKEYIEQQLLKSSLLKDKVHRFSAIDGRKLHPKYIENGILSKKAVKDILSDDVASWGLSITQGALGLILTYLEIFKQLADSDFPVITFEDDAKLSDDFDEYLSHVLKELPHDFDLCYLGHCETKFKKHNFSSHLSIPEGQLQCTPAMIISPNGAKKLIGLLKDMSHQIDTLFYLNFSSLKVFVTNSRIAVGGSVDDSNIQGNRNHIKKYKKQNYIFSTLAVGEFYNDLALKLAKDLRYFKKNILVVTDSPSLYSGMSNVIVVDYPNKKFSYNDKIICFREALLLEDCVVYTDCDSRVLYETYDDTFLDFCTIVPKGFHPSFSFGKVSRQDGGFFQSTDLPYRLKGYGEKCLELCKLNNFNYLDAEHWQEGFLILCKDDGKEQKFLDVWEKLSQELDSFEVEKGVSRIGIGEGNIIGIAAATSGITIHGPDICNLIGDHVRYNCHRQFHEYMKKYPKKKKVDYSDYKRVEHRIIDVIFKDKIVDLEIEVFDSGSHFFILGFQWNKTNAVDALDHEFVINNEVFHFQSEKQNSFMFEKNTTLKVYHTYDWFGEKNLKEILSL